MKTIIEHNGYTAYIEWRDEDDEWREGWWLSLTGRPFPVGRGHGQDDAEGVASVVREQFIGAPPPSDHAAIWGGYQCGTCGAKSVRLWRDYQTFLDQQTLRCRRCCETHEGKQLPEQGDQIGWSVPAVPTPDGSTFWGYTSVPLAAVAWWKALPETA